MKVCNVHIRHIYRPLSDLIPLFHTLATPDDRMLATDKWPAMKLDNGLQVGSKGGHGPIRYHVIEYDPMGKVNFQFDMKGFDGGHWFLLVNPNENHTVLVHTILMNTSGWATLKWALAIRWLHDAYIEDAFDKVENQFSAHPKHTQWNLWVRILRWLMKTSKRPRRTVR